MNLGGLALAPPECGGDLYALCRGETLCSWRGGVLCNGSYTGSRLCAAATSGTSQLPHAPMLLSSQLFRRWPPVAPSPVPWMSLLHQPPTPALLPPYSLPPLPVDWSTHYGPWFPPARASSLARRRSVAVPRISWLPLLQS